MHDFLDNLGAQQYEKIMEKCHQGRNHQHLRRNLRQEKCQRKLLQLENKGKEFQTKTENSST